MGRGSVTGCQVRRYGWTALLAATLYFATGALGQCTYSEWSSWNQCFGSRICPEGDRFPREFAQKRDRTVISGSNCDIRTQDRCYDTGNCDCDLIEWGSWSSCSTSCGEGNRQRQYATRGRCDGGTPVTETESCSLLPCGCEWGMWNQWSSCSLTCDSGRRQRSRDRLTPTACVLDNSELEIRPCNTRACRPCDWAPWNPWSACSASCGNAKRTRHRARRDPRRCKQYPKEEWAERLCSTIPCYVTFDDDFFVECESPEGFNTEGFNSRNQNGECAFRPNAEEFVAKKVEVYDRPGEGYRPDGYHHHRISAVEHHRSVARRPVTCSDECAVSVDCATCRYLGGSCSTRYWYHLVTYVDARCVRDQTRHRHEYGRRHRESSDSSDSSPDSSDSSPDSSGSSQPARRLRSRHHKEKPRKSYNGLFPACQYRRDRLTRYHTPQLTHRSAYRRQSNTNKESLGPCCDLIKLSRGSPTHCPRGYTLKFTPNVTPIISHAIRCTFGV